MTNYFAKIKHIYEDCLATVRSELKNIDDIDDKINSKQYSSDMEKAMLYDRAESVKKIDKIKAESVKEIKKATQEEINRLYEIMDIDLSKVDYNAIRAVESKTLTPTELKRLYDRSDKDTAKMIARTANEIPFYKGVFTESDGYDRGLYPIVNTIKSLPFTLEQYYIDRYEKLYYIRQRDVYGNLTQRAEINGYNQLIDILNRTAQTAETVETEYYNDIGGK